MEKSPASSQRTDFWGKGRYEIIKSNTSSDISFTNDSHQCYSTILRRLVSGVREMN